ncbi:response regulator [Enhydrobacter sp.]|jgi:signal transduction histidine kinase/DNA-binding response OmpR family regulator|uniref:response regulator n=1 Tax=Enhydrobacter sp. TaxID=1894999 RepID=UPI002635BFE6|nr:response regulator [Enhydrobacter sp.]
MSGGSLDQTELRFLVEKNADGIIVVDGDGVVLFANPAAEEIFGRPPAVLIGAPIGIPVAAGETTEIAVHRPDGRLVEAEIRVVDTVWNQQPARLATLRDVSARKAMEERLRHTAKMEAVGRLTAGIAHDFNNLLTVVLGNLDSARRQLASTEATLAQALENATRGAERAAGLTSRLLAFARRQPLEPRSVDVNALVEGMSDLLRRSLGEEIRVVTALAPEPWTVDVDPTELEAAILNLAVNARDAMPKGGELRIVTANVGPFDEARAAELDLAPGAYVAIMVEDSGTGMEGHVLKQALEPFFTTKGGRGTGLGLSQVYGFATQSGGTVALQSAPGRGTAVRIYLPKAEAMTAPEREREAVRSMPSPIRPVAEPHAGSGETILVVEDDEDVRRYAVGALSGLGYRVLEAGDGLEALGLIEREPALRLLLTDLGLPGGLDGRALGERARHGHPGLAVLIMTAYAATSLIHDGRLDPGIDLLAKPFTREALAQRVRALLDREATPVERRVLLVEDEVLVRLYAADALGALGCTVEQAASFKEARATLERLGPSLAAAVIDLGLPDRPGDALVTEIRALLPSLPILLATGYADAAVRARLPADPLLRIVGKPFQPHDLRSAFEALGLRLG